MIFVGLLAAALPFWATRRQREAPARPASAPTNLGGAGITPIADLVSFPSPEVEFITGPQLKSGSRLNPYAWYDSTQLVRGLAHGREFPQIPPLALTGTVAVAGGSATVSGTGTRFLSEVTSAGAVGVAPLYAGRLRVRLADGSYAQAQVASVDSDTRLTLTVPWGGASVGGAAADTYYNAPGLGWNNEVYINANYYDLGLCLYVLYYRTNDARYLTLARKVTDSWWRFKPIDAGRSRDFANYSIAPREASLGGLMLRALDGRPEMWDWLVVYSRFQFDNWLKARINDPTPYIGVRDGAFALQHAVWLAKVLPDSYPLMGGGTATNGAAVRAQFRADAEQIAVGYFGRLQQADGSWRWDDHYYTDEDGGQLRGVMQPFQVGLLLQALVDLHRLTEKPSVKAALQGQIGKACLHLYNSAYRNTRVAGLPGVRWRSFWYFYHGGTTVNPTKYAQGGGSAADTNAGWVVKSERQANALIAPAFGYVYALTGEPQFKSMGDELMEAAFGGRGDDIHAEADSGAKQYNQNFRMSGRYLVWRLGAVPADAVPTPDRAAGAPEAAIVAPGLISSALVTAKALAEADQLEQSQLAELVTQIEAASRALSAEKDKYVAPEDVLGELQAARAHMQTALRAAKAGGATDVTAKTRVQWAAARLKRASDRLAAK